MRIAGGGALVGDVFNVGTDEILSVNVDSSLSKAGNQLSVLIKPGSGIIQTSTGLAVVALDYADYVAGDIPLILSDVAAATVANTYTKVFFSVIFYLRV